MPPRRRSTSTTRRPRVAGLAPAGQRAGVGARPAKPEPPVVAEPVVPEEPAEEKRAGEPEAAPERAGDRSRTVLLAAALALAVALAVGFALLDRSARADPAAANTALTDVGTTAEVAGQLGSALETIYSYDYTRLDENERAAREVITPGFAVEFDELFADVRELAPAQQAVVSGTVVVSAVQRIEGDRAVLVAFMDQQATRVAAPDGSGQLAASSRLTVTGERVDGRWKIADVQSR